MFRSSVSEACNDDWQSLDIVEIANLLAWRGLVKHRACS